MKLVLILAVLFISIDSSTSLAETVAEPGICFGDGTTDDPTTCLSLAAGESKRGEALANCVFDNGKDLFETVKSTVGLKNQNQLEAARKLVKMICVDHDKLNLQDGLSARETEDILDQGIERSRQYVFEAKSI